MRTTRYSPQPQKGRQEVTVVRIYEATMMKGRELEKQATIISQRGNFELARTQMATAQSLFNAAQYIRPLVRMAETEYKIQSYQQALSDIDVLIRSSKSSQTAMLDTQKHSIYEKIQSLNDFLSKIRQGFTDEQMAKMKHASQELWKTVQGM